MPSEHTLVYEEDSNGDGFIQLPQELLDTLDWGEGAELEIEVVADAVVIKRAQ